MPEKPEPRVYTEEEVRKMFLEHVWTLVQFWENESRQPDVRAKLGGLAFSILATLDGSSIGIPAFIVAPHPHPSDKAFHSDEGRNYFPENHKAKVQDIAGSLHEEFHNHDPKRPA
jgi:hypothetical protein